MPRTPADSVGVLNWATHHSLTLPPQELHKPTHFPYNQALQPRRLDYILTKGVTAAYGHVIHCKDRASSDHDAVQIPIAAHRGGGGAVRSTWGPQLLSVPVPQGEDPHQVLEAISKAITVPGSIHNKFQESRQLRQLRQQAQQAPAGGEARETWKQVARLRLCRRERRLWDKRQAIQAANLDWKAMRSLQHSRTRKGWHLQLQDTEHWQQQLGTHFRSIFAKPRPTEARSRVQELADNFGGNAKPLSGFPLKPTN